MKQGKEPTHTWPASEHSWLATENSFKQRGRCLHLHSMICASILLLQLSAKQLLLIIY